MHSRLRRMIAAASAFAIVALTLPLTSPTPASADTLAPDDHCLGQCADILPPGENGNATLVEILANQSLGTMPRHSSDQLGRYADLVSGYTGLTDEQIAAFFNDASFGVPDGQVESTVSPRSDVKIVRDRATGVPHITGTTREGTMFGAGYAGAQDRLWVMDLIRHVGRGELTPFAGGAPGNRALEQSVWLNSPYTEADLQTQLTRLRDSGPRGAQLYADVRSYIDGINAYIDHCMAGRNCPGEYVLTGHLDAVTNAGGPQDFTMTDLIAISGVVGGLFGGGGGAEMQSALVRVAARARYGVAAGDRAWEAFRSRNDPETTLTLHAGQSFPSGDAPGATGVVLPDAATTAPVDITENEKGSATGPALTARSGEAEKGVLGGLTVDNARPGMSNAVVVSGAESTTGHPVAVFGPQTGYFAPQLLMLEELSGPGIRARGAAFAGLNLYVLLGRGTDYAWSATSSGQDITDTYALELCEPGGGTPTAASDHYLYRGVCTAMETLRKTNSWKPNVADTTAAGSYDLVIKRTKYGLVTWRGTVGGRPTAFASLRSTYGHEADSAIGFQRFNDPAQMGDPAGFTTAASDIGFAFNWFYVNSARSAYFMSGNTPVRSAVSDPNLPMTADAAHEWAGFDPETRTATYTAPATHPQAVDQDYFVSWNNKQAKDHGAADGNFSFGPVHRADLLDAPVKAALAGSGKLDRAGTVKIMAEAAVTDLRGRKVLPHLLRVIGDAPADPALASAVAGLKAWADSGAKRTETAPGSRTYAHAAAIRAFDAWWPRLVQAEFRPGMGEGLYRSLTGALQINESPSGHQNGDSGSPGSANEAQAHKGSSFQYGWWGYVSKDLRAVLGEPVSGPLPAKYCGDGTVAGCRTVLLDSLAAALAEPATTTYPADDVCGAGDQWCADSVRHSPLGGIKQSLISWQNRPTYQQVVSFPSHRGDPIGNLAAGRTAKASSSELFLLYPASKAVDGDPGSRWSSARSDDQYLQVDLGSPQTVARVLLRWESAYGSAYSIQTSADGSSWTTVSSTTTGNGGVDNVTFAPATARYVRMKGTKRATSYGYSLYEMEVYSR